MRQQTFLAMTQIIADNYLILKFLQFNNWNRDYHIQNDFRVL